MSKQTKRQIKAARKRLVQEHERRQRLETDDQIQLQGQVVESQLTIKALKSEAAALGLETVMPVEPTNIMINPSGLIGQDKSQLQSSWVTQTPDQEQARLIKKAHLMRQLAWAQEDENFELIKALKRKLAGLGVDINELHFLKVNNKAIEHVVDLTFELKRQTAQVFSFDSESPVNIQTGLPQVEITLRVAGMIDDIDRAFRDSNTVKLAVFDEPTGTLYDITAYVTQTSQGVGQLNADGFPQVNEYGLISTGEVIRTVVEV